MAWSCSAWLLPSFSPLPLHHIESWNVGREREIILAQWEIDPMSAAGHIGVAPIAMAASAVNKAMQCWKTIMDWIESAGDCETSPIASPFASLLSSPSGQDKSEIRWSDRTDAAQPRQPLPLKRELPFEHGRRIPPECKAWVWMKDNLHLLGMDYLAIKTRFSSFS